MKKILIVEDERAILRALQDWTTYSKEGYEVSTARNGEEALLKLENGNIDLILLDLVMPTMDGFQFLATLKERGLSPKVVVLSNLAEKTDIERARALGVVEYFIKTETGLGPLFETIKKLLN